MNARNNLTSKKRRAYVHFNEIYVLFILFYWNENGFLFSNLLMKTTHFFRKWVLFKTQIMQYTYHVQSFLFCKNIGLNKFQKPFRFFIET